MNAVLVFKVQHDATEQISATQLLQYGKNEPSKKMAEIVKVVNKGENLTIIK